jgi:hypothetical protein
MKVEDVVEQYVKTRDKRSELKAAYEKKDFVLKEAMETMDAWLLAKMDKDEVEAYRTESGTAYISKKVRYTCNDWTSFWGFISKTGRFDFLEKRPCSAPIKEYVEESEQVPPGLDVLTERVVNVRRGK